jgi:CheY-like chemotaxis protein
MNAAQAISDSGHIRITLREDEGQAVLSIKDDGAGMSDETRRRAFEPFYSVRPEGEGTGLGLSMVYGFVTQSGGDIGVRSELGHGTEITIRFPIASAELKLTDEGAFSGVVLIVDDREDIAVSIRAILDGLGFTTLLATRFSEAQDLIMQRSDISLIVSDLNLDHGQSGLRLIRSLLEKKQAALAILISSRLPDTSPMPPQYRHRFFMLDKPVAKYDLRRAITHLQHGYSEL